MRKKKKEKKDISSPNLLFFGVSLIFCSLISAVSCQKKQSSSPTSLSSTMSQKTKEESKIPDALHQEAKTVFQSRCVTCHGKTGAGDGPASKSLTPPPQDFTSPKWQSSVTDDFIIKIVSYGGGSVGKSVSMPSNPDLASKKQLTQALVTYIRSLKVEK